MRSIAEEIKRIRKAMEMNQHEFAEVLGASQGSVSKWERGLETPRIDMLMRIRTFYRLDEADTDALPFTPDRAIDVIDVPLTGALVGPTDEDLYSGKPRALAILKLPKHSKISGAVTAWGIPNRAERVANYKAGQIIFTHAHDLENIESGSKVILRETIHNGKFVYFIAYYGSSPKGLEWFTLRPHEETSVTLDLALRIGDREKQGIFPVGVIFGSIMYESARSAYWDEVAAEMDT